MNSRIFSPFWTMYRHDAKYSVCMGIHCQIISVKFENWNIHNQKLKTHSKKIYWSSLRLETVLESVQFHFHFFRRQIYKILSNLREKIQCSLPRSATSLKFDQQNHLLSISNLQTEHFSNQILWKLFDIGFPNKHCIPRHVCTSFKMAGKTAN